MASVIVDGVTYVPKSTKKKMGRRHPPKTSCAWKYWWECCPFREAPAMSEFSVIRTRYGAAYVAYLGNDATTLLLGRKVYGAHKAFARGALYRLAARGVVGHAGFAFGSLFKKISVLDISEIIPCTADAAINIQRHAADNPLLGDK